MQNAGHHFLKTIFRSSLSYLGFPVDSVVKSLPANGGDTGDMSSIPGPGRSSEGGNGNSLWHSCLGNPMDRGVWWATVHGVKKSWTQLSDWACTHARIYLPLPHLMVLLCFTFAYLSSSYEHSCWLKKIARIKVESYILFGRFTEDYSSGQQPLSSEWLFSTGKGGARVYRSFCWKRMNSMWLNIKRLMLITKKMDSSC